MRESECTVCANAEGYSKRGGEGRSGLKPRLGGMGEGCEAPSLKREANETAKGGKENGGGGGESAGGSGELKKKKRVGKERMRYGEGGRGELRGERKASSDTQRKRQRGWVGKGEAVGKGREEERERERGGGGGVGRGRGWGDTLMFFSPFSFSFLTNAMSRRRRFYEQKEVTQSTILCATLIAPSPPPVHPTLPPPHPQTPRPPTPTHFPLNPLDLQYPYFDVGKRSSGQRQEDKKNEEQQQRKKKKKKREKKYNWVARNRKRPLWFPEL